MMDSRERVMRTLEFNHPDRIPLDLWILPATRMEYGEQLEAILETHERDIASFTGPFDHGYTKEYYERGMFRDPWGCVWTNIQPGIIGEVKNPVFEEYDEIDTYVAPTEQFVKEWDANKETLAGQIGEAREKGKFIIGGWISIFERLQYLRGTENLYCDIALEEEDMDKLVEIVMGFQRVYLKKWLEMDIDAVAFGDDWGSQRSLLISPNQWRHIFKPLYQELIDMIKAAGKKVFFHSDGCIMDLYPEFIEMGVDALNSQLWCMDIEKIAENYAGKITFWGEISRQTTLPHGTPKEIREHAEIMKKLLHKNGGLIGESEVNRDVPLKNIETVLEVWND